MAVDKPGVWGIDLGQCGLKAIRLEEKDDEVVATAFDYIEHPKILSQPDADPDELTREALETFLSRNTIKGDKVVISVPGQSGLARFVKLPPVEEKKIADIVRFEAKQQIPFPLEEVVWDFQRLGAGIVTDGFAMEAEIGLFAMKRDMVNRAIHQFKDVNVEVHLIQMAPLCLCNYVSYDLLKKEARPEGADDEDDEGGGKKKCVVALDIGTDNSNLIITDAEKIIWQRPIPLGGNHFTRAMTKDLKLTFAKAEHLKRNAMKSPHLKKILGAIKAVLNDFVGEVQRSLGYFTNTHRDAEIEYMVGLGNAFRLPGLQKYLQEKLGLDVRRMQKFERLEGEEVTTAPQFKENVMTMAVAYGCALQGLEKTRLTTNLLPEEIQFEREVRAKKPWAAVAAAVLLFTVALLALGRHLEASKVKMTSAIKAENQTIQGLKNKIDRSAKDYQAEVDRIKKNESALDEISSGANVRHQWFMIYRFVNNALPRRNGKSLLKRETEEDRKIPYKLYFTAEAAEALAKLNSKRAVKPGTPPPDAETAKKIDRIIKENLIQINIESITSRYSDDLHSYFKNAYKKTKKQLPGMRLAQSERVKKLAEGKITDAEKHKIPKTGWVVEIRGFTFHKAPKFVRHTLVENLAAPEKVGVVYPQSEVDKVKKEKNFDQIWKTWDTATKAKWDLTTKLAPRVGYAYLLLNERIEDPKTKNFVHINRSYLSDAEQLFVTEQPAGVVPGKQPGDVNQGLQPPGQPPGIPNQFGVQGQQDANKTPEIKDRSKFRPLGEIAGKTLGQFQGPVQNKGNEGKDAGGFLPPNVPNGGAVNNAAAAGAKDNVPRFPRTEFVIHFVWQERMIGEPVLPQTAQPAPANTQQPPVVPGF